MGGLKIVILAVAALAAVARVDAHQDLRDLYSQISEMKARIEALEQKVADLEAAGECTNEYDEAVRNTSQYGFTTGAVLTGDGTPFVIDVASAFSNASTLLDAVRLEAARVEAALGYEVFVAGAIRPLRQMTYGEFYDLDTDGRLIPPDGHINIYCCYDEPGGAGVTYAWRRIIQLEADTFQSRHVILHELYHVLGLAHPGDGSVAVMSGNLMYGPAWITGAAPITRHQRRPT